MKIQGLIVAGLLALAMSVPATASTLCEYKIVTHGGKLMGGLAKSVANEHVADKWCDKFNQDEYELLVIVNSYSDDAERNHYAHAIAGVRKRGGDALPRKTFSAHSHFNDGSDRRHAVMSATHRAIKHLMDALDDLDVSEIR